MPDPRDEVIALLRQALKDVKQTLLIPAAELVPAIPDAWRIIDNALGDTSGFRQ
jgi:hypothetical protein